ncbi:hypothetical protein TL16_g03356 [Triparma laevis f. inornata]|uniref:Uncharacterized protein n=1 Tax=Triparma laevis f. inornata TaxID=1714386 RepID=A0A9W7A3B2_9STRA|nr:hypothetical protein TL16_g03356 [Triparma laevis f. inornata]
MEYYDATAIASTTSARQPAKKGGPFTKRRTTYPLLDRVKNAYHSKEFPEEIWEVRKQPLSGHAYYRHLETGKEFLHKDDARKLAIERNIYDPPAEEVVNPAAKYRGLPFLSRSQSNPHTFAISEEFPEDVWEVRRSQSCQYYFKHRKTGRELHRISDARTFTRRTGGVEGYGDIEEDIIKEEGL